MKELEYKSLGEECEGEECDENVHVNEGAETASEDIKEEDKEEADKDILLKKAKEDGRTAAIRIRLQLAIGGVGTQQKDKNEKKSREVNDEEDLPSDLEKRAKARGRAAAIRAGLELTIGNIRKLGEVGTQEEVDAKLG